MYAPPPHGYDQPTRPDLPKVSEHPGYGHARGQFPSYGQTAGQPAGGAGSGTTVWPAGTTPGPEAGDTLGIVATIALVVAGLVGLGYAAWAFTARRGVFADFADGVSVSVDDARSSDRIDAIFLIVAAVLAVVALTLWIVRRAQRRSEGSAVEVGGFAAAAAGGVIVVLGLFLAGAVTDDGSTAEQGDRGVTATIVVGAGFAMLAIGLLLGAVTMRAARTSGRGAAVSR